MLVFEMTDNGYQQVRLAGYDFNSGELDETTVVYCQAKPFFYYQRTKRNPKRHCRIARASKVRLIRFFKLRPWNQLRQLYPPVIRLQLVQKWRLKIHKPKFRLIPVSRISIHWCRLSSVF